MFKSSTEGVNSLTVDDVARQAVPESGTSSAEGSIANSHKPRSWHLQTMRLVTLVQTVTTKNNDLLSLSLFAISYRRLLTQGER